MVVGLRETEIVPRFGMISNDGCFSGPTIRALHIEVSHLPDENQEYPGATTHASKGEGALAKLL